MAGDRVCLIALHCIQHSKFDCTDRKVWWCACDSTKHNHRPCAWTQAQHTVEGTASSEELGCEWCRGLRMMNDEKMTTYPTKAIRIRLLWIEAIIEPKGTCTEGVTGGDCTAGSMPHRVAR